MKTIKNHALEGVFDPDDKFHIRSKIEDKMDDMLRDKGHVPVLDMSTQWYTSWDAEKERYDFKIIMFGVYVGKRKAKDEVIGWLQETGTVVPA